MKERERLKENLNEILEFVGDCIFKDEQNWVDEHKEDYYSPKATAEEKRLIEELFQDQMKKTNKGLKKIKEIKEFLNLYL